MHALNDSGAIKGMDAREDGVYITYVPTSGADTVTKKLGDIASAIKTGSYNYTHSKKGGFDYRTATIGVTYWYYED